MSEWNENLRLIIKYKFLNNDLKANSVIHKFWWLRCLAWGVRAWCNILQKRVIWHRLGRTWTPNIGMGWWEIGNTRRGLAKEKKMRIIRLNFIEKRFENKRIEVEWPLEHWIWRFSNIVVPPYPWVAGSRTFLNIQIFAFSSFWYKIMWYLSVLYVCSILIL